MYMELYLSQFEKAGGIVSIPQQFSVEDMV
jgi:hypothetical protein